MAYKKGKSADDKGQRPSLFPTFEPNPRALTQKTDGGNVRLGAWKTSQIRHVAPVE